jgi:hypothetical protein
MAKKLTFKTPGSLLDYAARKHKLNVRVDPSQQQFLLRSITTKGRISVVVKPGGENKPIQPITFTARVKSLTLKLEDVVLADAQRLKDIIFLVNDAQNTGDFTFEADKDGDLFQDQDEEA